jgi:hypothetical protein
MKRKRFKVEINTDQDIDDLKTKIQEKAKLSHLPSYDIDVFKRDNLQVVVGPAAVSDLEEPLSPSDKVGSHWSEDPPSNLVHVIVRAPKSMFEVFLHHQFIYI